MCSATAWAAGLAVGLARFFPQRLSSLVIGGWNLVSGVAPDHAGPMTFERWMRRAAGEVPERAALVTPDVFPGIHACFDALSHLEGAADAVIGAKVPVMIWNGRDDPHHDPMLCLRPRARPALAGYPR